MYRKLLLMFVWGFIIIKLVEGAISGEMRKKIDEVNKKGPYLGIVVPNSFEMNPLLQSPTFLPSPNLSYIDLAGKRFRVGTLENKMVIIVMTGLGMLNAGTTTQLLISLFDISGVLHLGIAGNGNPEFQIGDVTIPHYWAHIGLWNWQRYGDGPEDELSLESNGDYTRSIGYLNFSDYTNSNNNIKKNKEKISSSASLLNSVWFQPEEIFPIDGLPETRQHAFWVPVNNFYFSLAKTLEGMELEGCLNASTCLPRPPKLMRVERGVSSNVFVDNSAYREFLFSKFKANPIDMESAAVALISFQEKIPFIAFRALSDLAGGGSSMSNEASEFAQLASLNAAQVLIRFIALL